MGSYAIEGRRQGRPLAGCTKIEIVVHSYNPILKGSKARVGWTVLAFSLCTYVAFRPSMLGAEGIVVGS